jgi:hypothetical protein
MARLPDAKQMAHSITLKVRLPRLNEWRARLKIGSWLIRLAAWVMWLNIDIQEMQEMDV